MTIEAAHGLTARRLSMWESVSMAGLPAPRFEVGDRVRVFYTVQDPIDVVVTTATNELGWVEVEETYDGEPLRFEALANHCVAIQEEAA